MATSLKHLKLPLKNFFFEVGHKTEDHIFRELLQVHAETLVELFVLKERSGILYPNFCFGIHLPYLTTLRFGNGIVANLNFLKHMPVLKSVSLGSGTDMLCWNVIIWSINCCQTVANMIAFTAVCFPPPEDVEEWYPIISNTNFDELNNLVFPTMRKFAIAGHICTGEQIGKLAKIMPNLTKLNDGLGNDGFQMVCSTWKNLQKLVIHPFQVDEVGLLGNKIGKGRYHLPNITDLQGNLRVFFEKGSKIFEQISSNEKYLF